MSTASKTKIRRDELHKRIRGEYGMNLERELVITSSSPKVCAKELDDASLIGVIELASNAKLPLLISWRGPLYSHFALKYLASVLLEYKYRTSGMMPAGAGGLWDWATRHVYEAYPNLDEFVNGGGRLRHLKPAGQCFVPYGTAWVRGSCAARGVAQRYSIRKQLLPGLIWTRRKPPAWYTDNAPVIEEQVEIYCDKNDLEIV